MQDDEGYDEYVNTLDIYNILANKLKRGFMLRGRSDGVAS